MQINNLGGVQAYNLNLPNQARTLKNIPEPKFNSSGVNGIFVTKAEATRSDEEIINDAIALANKFAQDPEVRKKNGYLSVQQKQEIDELLREYMAPYSPDRKAVFAKGLDSSLTEIKSRISKPIIDMSLFEFVYFRKNSVKASLWYDADNKKIDVGTIQFFENGEPIGEYNGFHGFWAWTPTKAEVARRVEFNGIFCKTLEAEMNNAGKTAATANSTSFDFAAHNVSNQQNQASQTATAQQAISRYEQMQHA